MNRKKYITLTLMLSLLFINKTYAACTQEEINEFKSIEDEYKITYEFNNGTKEYIMNIYSPLPDKYDFTIYAQNKMNCKRKDTNNVICSNLQSGNYEIQIVGQTSHCKDIFKSYNLELPKYNNFSEDPLCDGIEEFVLCQPTYSKEIDYETFVSRVNTYKKTQQEKINKEDDKQDKNKEIGNQIITYIKENLIQIIIVVVFIVLIITTSIVTYKSLKKSRRLE